MTDTLARVFRPAFDMPTTAAEALAVILAWGDPLTMTFDPRRAKRAGELIAPHILSPQSVPFVLNEVLDELDKATTKFPTWPTDPLHALAVLGEEYGELNKATLQAVYEPHKNPAGAVRSEAVQTAAMALRFLASIDRYRFVGSQQHEQAVLTTTREAAHG